MKKYNVILYILTFPIVGLLYTFDLIEGRKAGKVAYAIIKVFFAFGIAVLLLRGI